MSTLYALVLNHFVLTALASFVIIVLGSLKLARTPPGRTHNVIKNVTLVPATLLLFTALIGLLNWVLSFL